MVAMGTAGLASIPYMMLVASVIPLLVGIILGNLDPKMRKCLSDGGEVTIMVLGFALGANMSLQQVARGGVSGVVLGLITVIIGGVFNIFFDKLTGGSGIAGAAISSVGGNAVATPAALAGAPTPPPTTTERPWPLRTSLWKPPPPLQRPRWLPPWW